MDCTFSEFVRDYQQENYRPHQYGYIENELFKNQAFSLQNNATQMKYNDNLNDLEQYGHCDCLKICGIPAKREENTDRVVDSVQVASESKVPCLFAAS